MELKAAIEGIKLAADESKLTLYTDSKYVMDGITSDWKLEKIIGSQVLKSQ